MRQFPSVTFSLVLFAMGFGAHYVVLAWARRVSPRIARQGWPALVACAVLSILPSIGRYLTLRTQYAWADALLAVSLLEMVVVLVAALPLLLLRWLGGGVKAKAGGDISAGTSGEPSMGRRRAIETSGGAAVLGSTGLAVGWGATLGRHDYHVEEVPVRIRGLPRALDGYVIAQISDIHAGLFVGEVELRQATDRIRAIRPDLLVVTGDLVDFDERHAPALARALADMAPRDGVRAILGNHDYYADADAVAEALQRAGVDLLVNDGRVIRPADGGGFALLGLDDQWSRRYGGPGPRLQTALATVPRDLARVLLSHQPDTFDRFGSQVALQLSGHTHGGQIAPAGMLIRYRAGRYERGESTLYVNRGFGVAGPPARIGVPPELTKIVLVAA